MCALDWKSGYAVHVHGVEHRVPPAHAAPVLGGGRAAVGGVPHVVSGVAGGHGDTYGGLVDNALHHDSGWNFVVGGN